MGLHPDIEVNYIHDKEGEYIHLDIPFFYINVSYAPKYSNLKKRMIWMNLF
jgi:hypothetical protein